MNFMETLARRIKTSSTRIVFPEGEEENIILATVEIRDKGYATPILLGAADRIEEKAARLGKTINGISVIEPANSPDLPRYIEAYSEQKAFPEAAARRLILPNLGFGAMMVKNGDADAMAAGIAHPTEQVIMLCQLIIGMQEGISTPSSFMVMDIPEYKGEEGSLLVVSDPALNPLPTADQLADIAITTAGNVRKILGWEPRVAMLSFSTHGSASHPLVDHVVQTVELIRQRSPHLLVDGELQLDAAIVPEVADRKVKHKSQVAGRANILVFPDLGSANIGCKLIQRLAGAKAYGAVLQGFALPASDLSRGAKVEDIVGVAIMLALQGDK